MKNKTTEAIIQPRFSIKTQQSKHQGVKRIFVNFLESYRIDPPGEDFSNNWKDSVVPMVLDDLRERFDLS